MSVSTETDSGQSFGDFKREAKQLIDRVVQSSERVYTGTVTGNRERLVVVGCRDETALDALERFQEKGLAAKLFQRMYPAGVIDNPPEEILSAGDDNYQPFPSDALPDVVANYIEETSAAIGCDPAYVALPLLAALGACVGNTHRLVVKRGWYELPILWTAIIGDSGTAKTPALSAALEHVQAIQAGYLKEHSEAMQEYNRDLLSYQQDLSDWKKQKGDRGDPPEPPEQPQAKRLVIQDTTIESLAPILTHNRKGVLMKRDELSGWFGSFNRYSGKAGADEASWLSLFNGESITVDRKGTGTLYVHSGVVSITGGIQPGILAEVLSDQNRESGMAARILMAQPPKVAPRWSDREVSETTAHAMAMLFERLTSLEMRSDGDRWESNYIGMTAEAKRVWVAYHDHHQTEQEELYGDFAAAWAKLRGYVPRIALLVEMLTSDPIQAVSVDSMRSAVRLVDWFKSEASRVYTHLADDRPTAELRKLVEWIQRKHSGVVTPREVVQGVKRIKNVDEAEAELNSAVRSGFGSWDADRKKRVFRTN